jgi:hypothetical protein
MKMIYLQGRLNSDVNKNSHEVNSKAERVNIGLVAVCAARALVNY